ncbi:tetratricopeptide repeat protein [Geodermatophilus saharensis]|uniref:tetratricopeptide repeat protein n=1 Tax=Geodermatophilus saharensis TaxID=1137994 RepID=UPI0015954A1B|nr:toll/interleukin-1 receptor domain-containing protein [Geodermatophilus saharensis]
MSWTRADTDRHGPLGHLVDALRDLGVPVWVDDAGIGPFDSVPDRVREGLAASRVVLAWYSHAYPTRRACREELTLALLAAERAGQGAGRVLVVNPESGMGHVLEGRLLERRFAGPDDLADLPGLAARIADRVPAHPVPFGALPAPGRPRWYGGAGWEGSSIRFVGRLGQLWAVHDRLHRTTGLAGPGAAGRSVAVVSGFGGMGKSLLAAEYAHLFADCYPGGVVWLSAAGNDPTGTPPSPEQTRAAADTQIAAVATALEIDVAGLDPDTVRERVKTALDERGQPVLWIADDLPTGLDAAGLDAWRCPAAVVHEIITTRDRAHSKLDRVDLDELSDADALALLTQGRPLLNEELEQARLLAEDLGHHPLACDVAGLYLAGTGTTFTAYRRRLNADLGRFDQLAARLADQLPGGHARQITATLATSLNGLGKDAWTLLRLTGQLAPTAIPRRLIADVFARRGASSDAEDGGKGGDEAEDAVDRALLDPHRDGLFSADPATQTVLVHVLVRAAAILLDPHPDDQAPTRAAAVTALLDQFGDAADDVRRHPPLTDLAAHARHLTTTSEPLLDVDAVRLLALLARYDLEAGRPALAAQEYERTLVQVERLLGPDHPDTLITRGDLAFAYQDAGRLDQALPLYERTLADRDRLQGPDHPHTLTSRGNLAAAYHAAGRLDQALPLFERTLADHERLLGPDHPATLTSRNNVAAAYHDAGRTTEALPLHERTLTDVERLLGPDHPHTLGSRHNLAFAYRAAGRLDEALPLYERTLADRERILGPDHPDTVTSRGNLAQGYGAAGRLTEALPLYERTLADFKRLLGPDHPATLASRGALAFAYQDAGRLDQALPLYERTLADHERLQGPDHPHTLTSRSNVAAAYHAAGRLDEALPLFERTLADHERLQGPDHPHTLTSRSNVAAAYHAAGRLDEALPLYERTLADRERILGPGHPATLTSREALAAAYRAAGRTDEASALYERNLTEPGGAR